MAVLCCDMKMTAVVCSEFVGLASCMPKTDRRLSVPQQSRISAYLLWAREVRDFVVNANPTLDFSQINKRLGAMWNTLPDAKKYVSDPSPVPRFSLLANA